MDNVLRALKLAGQDLFTARMLGLVLWPMGLALLFWLVLAWLFGTTWQAEATGLIAATPLQDLVQWIGSDWLLAYAAFFLVLLLWLPAVYLTALLITSVALMPIIVNFVAARHYPALDRRRGGGLLGSLGNSLVALALYVLAWLILLPLWLFAPFGLLVSLLLNAWFNQRLFLYDAAADHAGRAELARLREAGGWPLYALSGLLALLHFVPVLNFLAPVYMALAFVHYALGAIQAIRKGQLA